AVYDTLYLLNGQYVKYQEKDKWGLKSYTGRKIAPASYDDIFIEGNFMIFEKQGRYGIANDRLLFDLANEQSSEIPFAYDDFVLLDDKMLLGIAGDKQTVLNYALEAIIPQQKQVIHQLREGWLIRKDDKFRFYSEEMIPLSNAG